VFETLFKYPGVLARHRGGPSADLLEQFLVHCADQRLAHATILHVANEMLVIAGRIDLSTGSQIGLPEIEAAADGWARHQRDRGRAESTKWSRERFIQTAVPWFRFLGRFREAEGHPQPEVHRVQDFASFMRDERGLSEVTIRGRCWHVERFLDWLKDRNRSFDEVTLQDVDAFLAGNGKAGWNRVSVATSANALRSFFRHAEIRGWCALGTANGIEGPRIFQQEALPAGPAWEEVQRLIASTDGDEPREIRDRAILMLFAVYAFRSGEVAGLCVEDVNWEKEIISIPRPKQRRTQQYPLVSEVGETILRYLRQVRPRCSRREIFLSLKAPFRPLSPGALYHVVSTRLSELGIATRRRGPHSLRHACAGHLVSAGLSLKQIGDHLGHRSAYATRVYAKVDLAGLRKVADFDLGGLI
jgi:site-specific recombinase XerD